MKIQKKLSSLLLTALFSSLTAHAQTKFENWSGDVFESSNSPVIYTPRSVEQVVALVKKAAADKRKVRVSGARHSWSSIVLADNSTYLSTVNLKKIGSIQKKEGVSVITVQAGVMLGELTDYLYEKGYSLGFAMPEFRGLTIGGLVATGSHGSSRRHIGVSNQLVNGLQLVTAAGEVRQITRKDGDLFKAATVNLGALGVVTELELILSPRFNLEVTTSVMDLQKQSMIAFLNDKPQEDFLFMMWFPKLKKAILESGRITQKPAERGAENVMFGLNTGTTEIDYATANFLAKGRADATGAIEAAIEAKRFEGLIQRPRFVVEENGFDVNKALVVGPGNKMIIARGDTITWPYKLSDHSFSFPLSDLQGVMKTIETFAIEKNYSFPNAGISMRFVRSDGGQSSLLSPFEDKDHKNELFVSAEFLEFRDYNLKGPSKSVRDPMKYELLALLVSKHQVRFHWGKNDDVSLKSQPAYLNSSDQYSRFSKVVSQLDPNGIFMSDFVAELLKNRSTP